MANPLGFVRDQNVNPKQVDVWALILNTVCVNTILASYNDILAIKNSYDYCVDLTVQGQSFAGINSVYNPSNDTFVPPPPPIIDWVQNVEYDFDGIIGSLQQAAIDVGINGGNLSSLNINAAYNSALTDSPGMTTKQLTIVQGILQYLLGGAG